MQSVNQEYNKLLQVNDSFTQIGIERQVTEPECRYVGGIMDPHTGIPRPNHGGSAAMLATWAASYANPDSTFYHSSGLADRMAKLAKFMTNHQHEDGTITLGSTNYHSPPDTGFVIVGVAQVCKLLEQLDDGGQTKPVLEQLDRFLRCGFPAMLTGGCHTPNHRWVLSAALGLLYERFGDSALAKRADEWLAEGMDMTEDGEWTERSNGIYNAVSDIMLYHAAKTLNRPVLLEPIRRNLRMMAYLIHPAGEVVTDYSGRQDFGEKSDLSSYYPICRLMALEDEDGMFAALADAAAKAMEQPGGVNNHAMLTVLLSRDMRYDGIERVCLPQSYHVVLNERYPSQQNLEEMRRTGRDRAVPHSAAHTSFGSPVVRFREGETSVTIMTRNPSFFALRHGDASLLGMKLTSALLPGVVPFDRFSRQGSGYRLSSTMEKGYYGPVSRSTLDSLTHDRSTCSPWYLLPHAERPVTHLQTHNVTVDIVNDGAAWKLRFLSDQADDLFTQLTFYFAGGGELIGDGIEPSGKDGHYFLQDGEAIYRMKDSGIRIRPGAHEHKLRTLRGDAHSADGLALSINWMTPFDHTITVEPFIE